MDEEKGGIYKGVEKDIVLNIPKNTVEIKIELTTFENGESHKYSRTMDVETINNAEDIFEDTIRGDYPMYVITDEEYERLDAMRGDEVVEKIDRYGWGE